MKIKNINEFKTAEEARQFAIDWQNNILYIDISYMELALAQSIFKRLAEKFNLTEEFLENGII